MTDENFLADEGDIDEFDTTGHSADDLGGGNMVNRECKCHWLVKGMTKEGGEDGKTPCRRFDLEVLASDVDDQVGRTYFHRVYTAKKEYGDDGKPTGNFLPLTKGGMNNVLRFALGLQLIREEDIGGPVRIPWHLAEGRQCCSEVKAEKDKDEHGNERVSYKIPFSRVYPPNHPEVEGWPKDPDALALWNADQPGDGGDQFSGL